MKRIFLALALLASASCVREPADDAPAAGGEEVSNVIGVREGALAGVLSVCVSPELADRIEASAVRLTRSGEALTRSGVADMDAVLGTIGAERFERMFPYEERFEARHREAGLHLWYTIRFDRNEDLAAAARLLGRIEGVTTVQYRHRIVPLRKGPMIPYNKAVRTERATRAAEAPMNDPLLADQWHYYNDGSLRESSPGADVNLFEAWRFTTGSPEIVVAVIDEPVQYTHKDLAANMWVNPHAGEDERYGNDVHGCNFARTNTTEFDWTSNYYDDIYREWYYADHGTHVAGTVAAVNGNGIGVCGVAGGENGGGGVRIMGCQILDCNESDAYYNDAAAAQAFVYAADRGALIAQCSWGYQSYGWGAIKTQKQWEASDSGAERKAIDYFIQYAGADNPASPLKGGLVIFAAGNDGDLVGDQMTWPAAYSAVISVAAMSPNYTPAYFTDFGSWVDITAPGGDQSYGDEYGVLSCVLDDPSMKFQDGRDKSGYGFMQGTSMACPHVSGIAALGLAYAAKLGKQFTPAEFRTMLLSSANDLEPYLTGTKNYGSGSLNLERYRKKMGTGFIDACKLMLEIEGTPSLYIPAGSGVSVDLTKYFGAGARLAKFEVEVDAETRDRLDMLTPTVENGVLNVTCRKPGVAQLTVSTVVTAAGEPDMSKKLALIARDFVAGNGGWL